MRSCEVESAGIAYSDRLAAVHIRCFTRAWSSTEIAGLLAQTAVHGLLAKDDGEDTGMALLRVVADEAEILTIGVIPESRSRGVGRQLLETLEETAQAAGAARVFLEVSHANAAARRLYDQAGYSEIGLRKAYYADGNDAHILEKRF